MPDREEVVVEVDGALTVLLVANVGITRLVIELVLSTRDDCIWELPIAELDIIVDGTEGGPIGILLVVVIGPLVVGEVVIVVVVIVAPIVGVAAVVLVTELIVE